MMNPELQQAFEVILRQLCQRYSDIDTEEYEWGGHFLNLQRIALYCGAEDFEYGAILHNAWAVCRGKNDRIDNIRQYIEDCRLTSILHGVEIEKPQ